MEDYIFVNYAHEDRDEVLPIIERLKTDGLNILHGSMGDEKVAESRFVLNLYTPAAKTSRSYRKIMNSALKHEKELVTLNIGPGGRVPEAGLQLEMFFRLFMYHYCKPEAGPDMIQESESAADINAAADMDKTEKENTSAVQDPKGSEPASEPMETKRSEPKAAALIPELPDRDKMYEEGMRHLNEDNDGYDPAEAFSCLWQAANRGHVDAQYQLSMCYAKGIGIRVSINEAARYLEMAAYGGHVQAQAELGYCYETGYGVVRKTSEALRWYRIAADNGSSDAKNNLAYLYQKGKGVPRDVRQAIALYEDAAKEGHASAMFNLGYIYWYGEGGVSTNRSKAISLFKESAAGGNGRAAEMMKIIRQLGYN